MNDGVQGPLSSAPATKKIKWNEKKKKSDCFAVLDKIFHYGQSTDFWSCLQDWFCSKEFFLLIIVVFRETFSETLKKIVMEKQVELHVIDVHVITCIGVDMQMDNILKAKSTSGHSLA